MNNAEILKPYSDLQVAFSIEEKSNIDGFELCKKLKMIIKVYDDERDVIVLRIIAATPVERSFSKCKLIKTNLRNSMTQERCL